MKGHGVLTWQVNHSLRDALTTELWPQVCEELGKHREPASVHFLSLSCTYALHFLLLEHSKSSESSPEGSLSSFS